ARHSLRQALSELRGLLRDEAVIIDGERVSVADGAVSLDVNVFERSVAAGDLAEAVALCDGEFLAGCEDMGGEEWRTWIAGERACIWRQLSGAFGGLVKDAMDRGAWTEAATAAERWRALQPAEEAPVAALVRALIAGDEQIAAAAHHQAFVTRMREEGLEPSAAFVRLGRTLGN